MHIPIKPSWAKFYVVFDFAQINELHYLFIPKTQDPIFFFFATVIIFQQKLCSSRKNPYPPHGRSLEIPKGRWGAGEGGGGGCKTKNLPWRKYG